MDAKSPLRLSEPLPETLGVSEWTRYRQLLKAFPNWAENEVFLGLIDGRPVFCPHSVFEGHVHLVGGTGTGKTKGMIASLLAQLGDPDVRGPCPIIIIDPKNEGDRVLRGLAEALVAVRHGKRPDQFPQQSLTFYSNQSLYRSRSFDPWKALSCLPTLKGRAQQLITAILPTNTETPDAVFFLNENRTLIEELFQDRRPPKNFLEMLTRLKAMSRGKGGNREARGVHGGLSDFLGTPHLILDGHQTLSSELLDFGRALETNEVVYIHLSSQESPLNAKSIGRFMIFCLMAEASLRMVRGGAPKEFYLFVDELQTLLSENVAGLLNTVRSTGARCIFSHQTTASFAHSDGLSQVMSQGTRLQIMLSPDDQSMMDVLRYVSGETIRYLLNGSETTGQTVGHSHASASNGGWTDTTSFSESHSQTEGWQEQYIPALTPEMIRQLDANVGTAIVRVKKSGASSGGLTAWERPMLINFLFPLLKKHADELDSRAWELEPSKTETATNAAQLALHHGTQATRASPANPLRSELETGLRDLADHVIRRDRANERKKTETP